MRITNRYHDQTGPVSYSSTDPGVPVTLSRTQGVRPDPGYWCHEGRVDPHILTSPLTLCEDLRES